MSDSSESTAIERVPMRMPMPKAASDTFGLSGGDWKVLVEATFPNAESPEAVLMALAYCRRRNLDIFKKPVHIVPIWNRDLRRMVETVWIGIAEIRTTAARTGEYAGKDATEYGPDTESEWQTDKGTVSVSFPEWAQVTVYRLIKGHRCAFVGPRVYWLEAYAGDKHGTPNSMWQRRAHGQLDKCAEAAALRVAFPEELGDEWTADEAHVLVEHGNGRPAFDPSKMTGSAEEDPLLADAVDTSSDLDPETVPPSDGDDLFDGDED